MTDTSADYMTTKYKMVITAGIVQLKPQSASKIDLCLIHTYVYVVSTYGIP